MAISRASKLIAGILALAGFTAAGLDMNARQFGNTAAPDIYGIGIVVRENIDVSEFNKLGTTFSRKNGTDALGSTSYTYQGLPVRLFIRYHPSVSIPNNIEFDSALADPTPTPEEMYETLRDEGITTYMLFDTNNYPESFIFTHMPQ
jgi:hypothetical protein